MSFRLLWFCAARLAAVLAFCALCGGAGAQTYPDMASEPDPASFVKRADTGLTLLGNPLRFAGADINWLGLRQDAGGPPRRPTEYEVRDALQTLQALGGTVFRAATLAGTAGCTLCLEPAKGQFNADAFAALDATLKTAGDMGMRVILPLAGGGADCAHPPREGPDAVAGTSICAYLSWQGLTDRAAFFTDPAVRADFLAHVHAVLTHVNALTGIAYRDDPTILAWENCAGCGEGSDPAAVAAWTEAVGQAIKSTDRFHLYENGAFAGHILPQSPQPVPAADFAPPSVDIVGDSGLPTGDEAFVRATLAAASVTVARAGRAYVLDGFDWGPRFAATEEGLETFLNGVFRERAIAGALVQGLQSHADTGGYLPAPPASAYGGTALYFPGRPTADIAKDDMIVRARALRRFEYDMSDILLAPAYLLPPKPEIIAVRHGQVTWRGAAGALDYTIERSPNPDAPNSWDTLCDACATDQNPAWQDPSPPIGPAWYRIMPFNINGHRAVPSAPVANQ
jgi:mannan endo-1,4-beta-mannosidase